MPDAIERATILGDIIGDMADKEAFGVDFFAVERDRAAETGKAGIAATGAVKVEGMHL